LTDSFKITDSFGN